MEPNELVNVQSALQSRACNLLNLVIYKWPQRWRAEDNPISITLAESHLSMATSFFRYYWESTIPLASDQDVRDASIKMLSEYDRDLQGLCT
jgi:hypothetical protein